MKILTRYVALELFKVFAVSLASMTLFMIVVGVMTKAYSEGLGLKQIVLLVPYFLPEALRFAVPGTVLFAACSVYGRLAASNEVVAVKASGINPMVLFWPTFILSALLSLATVWLNDVAASWGRAGITRIVIASVEEIAYTRLAQQKSFARKNFAINVKAVEGRRLIGPTFTFQANLDTPAYTVTAAEAELRADPAHDTLTVYFHDADIEIAGSHTHIPSFEYDLPLSEATRKGRNEGSPSDLPLHALPGEIEAQKAANARIERELAARAGFQMITGEFGLLGQPSWQPLHDQLEKGRERLARLQMESPRRWANGFSCLCFVIVGAPLAVLLRNRDFLTSFFLCFGPILLVYYPLLMLSVVRAKSGDIPSFSVWLGNVILLACGAWLLRRVLRH